MGYRLHELADTYRSLSIVGMSKNAGKTTVLNSLIDDYRTQNKVLGLTSIGRDGEAVDLVTGTQKPDIQVDEGTLIATAAGLLRAGDITKEILETTGISTPMGDVVLLRALSDGSVQLAGPSMVDQLKQVSDLFWRHGAGRIIIDGAINRRTLCTRELAEGTILCTGASLDRDIGRVVDETRHICELLQLPQLEDAALLDKIEKHRRRGILLLGNDEPRPLGRGVDLADALRAHAEEGISAVCFDGAMSDGMMQSLLASGMRQEGLTLIVRDASRILLGRHNYGLLVARGCRLRVERAINLIAVTINPFSAYGYHFDKDDFMKRMAAAVPVPVINVKEP